ncbi:MAG: N-acetylmuramoyl-L-alanine amidase [Candidatus Obscuribacterales bacterium]|nr:N-acetylmuramoyl-L-alanine amidase [Candidatus Obscuribacterales bacterium]
MKIGIDKGHNLPVNRGATGIEQEDDLIFELASLVIEKLRLLDFQVIDCTPDQAQSLGDALRLRVEKAHEENVDIFVSIHFNAFNGSAHGTEVLHFPGAERAIKIAGEVLKEIAGLGFANRGLKPRSDLYVLKRTVMPAILIEVCFCDSKIDMSEYRKLGVEKVAEAICRGLEKACR